MKFGEIFKKVTKPFFGEVRRVLKPLNMINNIKVVVELNFDNISTTKQLLFREISTFIAQSLECIIPRELIENTLHERERLGTTGFGNGLAIPHGKLEGLPSSYLFYIRLNHPVEWESLDETLVTDVFVILVPEDDETNEHLKILSTLCYNLMDHVYQKEIKTEKDKDKVLSIIMEMFEEKERE